MITSVIDDVTREGNAKTTTLRSVGPLCSDGHQVYGYGCAAGIAKRALQRVAQDKHRKRTTKCAPKIHHKYTYRKNVAARRSKKRNSPINRPGFARAAGQPSAKPKFGLESDGSRLHAVFCPEQSTSRRNTRSELPEHQVPSSPWAQWSGHSPTVRATRLYVTPVKQEVRKCTVCDEEKSLSFVTRTRFASVFALYARI